MDRDDPVQVVAAGGTLSRLHLALRMEPDDRPMSSPWAACFWPGDHDPPGLRGRSLDIWDGAFVAGTKGSFPQGVVHGDFWADNLVWSGDRIAAVIDWSEARRDVQSRELAVGLGVRPR